MSSGDNIGNAELAPAARAAVATTSSKKYDKPISTSSATASGATVSNDTNNNSKSSTAGTMRVKVTGDDGSRNGPPASGGPPTAVRSVAAPVAGIVSGVQEKVIILEKPLARSKFLGGTPDGRVIVQKLDGLPKNANGGPLPKPTKPTDEQQRTEPGVVAQSGQSVVLCPVSNASNGSGANLGTAKKPITIKIMVPKESVIPDKGFLSGATIQKATAASESVVSNGNSPDNGGERLAPPTETSSTNAPSTKEREIVKLASVLSKQPTLPGDDSTSADGEQSGPGFATAGGVGEQEEPCQLGSESVSKMPREMKQLEIATKASKFFSNDSANQSLPSPHVTLRLRDRSRTKSPSNQRLSTAAPLTRAHLDCFDEEESSTNSTDISAISTRVGSSVSISSIGSSVSSLLKRYSIGSSASATQLIMSPEAPPKPGSDRYCWKCKKPNVVNLNPKSGMVACSTCPRSFHAGCIRAYYATPVWRCNECFRVDPLGPSAATTNAIADPIKMTNLQKCLDYALAHISESTNGKLLFNPFDKSAYSGYDEKVSHHVDLCVMRNRNDKQQYCSTEAFLSDLSWIQHNMQIIEAEDPTLIQCAKQMYKKGKKQLSEIDLCYECYINIQFNEKWFELACSKPHLLVWAKLKGYPYWPAKVFANASLVNQVLVLFFGAHDRATIAPKDCFLFSEQDPNNKPAKRPNWDNSMNEARAHISRVIERFGLFRYAETQTPLDVRRIEEYTKNMIPGAFASLHSTVERIGGADAAIGRSPVGSGDGSEPHSSTDCAAKSKITMKILKNSGKVVAISSLSTPEASGPATNVEFPSAGTSTTGEKLSDDTAGGGASGSLNSQSTPPEPSSMTRITRRMSRKSVSAKEHDSAVEEQSVGGTGRFVELRKKRKSVGMMDTEKRLEHQQQQQQQQSQPQPRESDKVESLLIRRNSATWETEPISKRRKSTAKNRDRPKTPSASGANQQDGARETSEHEGSHVTRLLTTGKEPECVPIPVGKLLLRRKSVAHCLRPSPDTESPPVDAAANLPMDNGSTMPSAVDEPPLGPSNVTSQPGTSDLNTLLTIETDESLNVSTDTALDPNMTISAEIKQEPVSDSEDGFSTTEDLSSVQQAATVADLRNIRRSISADTSNSAQQYAVDQGLTSGKDDTPVLQSRNKSKEGVESSLQTSVIGQRARKTFPVGNKNAPKQVGSSATSTAGSTEPKQAPVPHMVNIPNPLPTSLGNGFKADFTITGSRGAVAEPGIIGPAVSILMVSNTGSSNGCPVTPVPTPTTSAVPSPTPVPPATGALDSPIATTKVEKQYSALSKRLPSGTDVIGGTGDDSLANLRPPPLQAKPTAAPIPGNAGEVMAVSQSRSAPMVSNLVVQASARMTDYCQRLLEDMLTDFALQGSLEAKVAQLHLELNNAEKRHQVEQARLTQEHAKQLEEQRLKLEREKDAAMREVRQNAAAEKDRAVAVAKKTQWCKRCPKEAMYYCCWNTSYCDPNCQQSDWSSHQKVCTQVQNRAERPVVASGSTVASGSPDNTGAASTDVIVLDDSPVRAGSAGRKRPSARISPSSGAKARIIPRSTFNGTITYPKPIQITDVVGNTTETGERRHVSSVNVLPSSSGPEKATAVRITMPANRPLPPVIAPRRSTSHQTAERPKSNSMHGSMHNNNPYVRERLFNNNAIASLDSSPSRLTAYTVLSANHAGATTGGGPRVWNQFYLPSTSDYTRNDATRRAALPNGT